jgi:hypothetical protein
MKMEWSVELFILSLSQKESDRERRREGGQEKSSRDRGRVRDEELPSLMNLMTQHPAHPAQYSPRRGRDDPQEHRSSTRGNYKCR